MIPVPADVPNPPEGVLTGKDVARQLFASHHQEKAGGATLECKRAAANGNLVIMECRVEGNLNGELVANHFVFSFEVSGGQITSMFEFARFPGLAPQKLQAAHDGNLEQLRQAGFEADGCQLGLGETAIEVVRDAIIGQHDDAVLIGAGIRLVPSNSQLFEAIVNTVHELLPSARFVFNQDAVTGPDDIRRWFPDPALTS
jgi:hypothetical protein